MLPHTHQAWLPSAFTELDTPVWRIFCSISHKLHMLQAQPAADFRPFGQNSFVSIQQVKDASNLILQSTERHVNSHVNSRLSVGLCLTEINLTWFFLNWGCMIKRMSGRCVMGFVCISEYLKHVSLSLCYTERTCLALLCRCGANSCNLHSSSLLI